MTSPVDLVRVLSSFDDAWQPRTVAVVNEYDVRVFKARGEFTRHSHPDTDELFLVLRGLLTIHLDDADVELGPGQLFVVPRGVPHQPSNKWRITTPSLASSASEKSNKPPG